MNCILCAVLYANLKNLCLLIYPHPIPVHPRHSVPALAAAVASPPPAHVPLMQPAPVGLAPTAHGAPARTEVAICVTIANHAGWSELNTGVFRKLPTEFGMGGIHAGARDLMRARTAASMHAHLVWNCMAA